MNKSRYKNIAIHIDGGEGVGLGHATRGLGVAASLYDRGYKITFLADKASDLSSFIQKNGYQIRNCKVQCDELVSICDEMQTSTLIIDSYKIRDEDFGCLKENGLTLVCFDDTADRELPVDILINGSPAAVNLSYRTGPDTKMLLGLDYQVVRKEFVPAFYREYGDVHTILVTTGGDDLMGVFPELISFFGGSFCTNHPEVEIDLVVGPYFKDMQTMNLPNKCRIHRNPTNIRSLMMKADIAVSAGGQTLYELARCSTPTVAFCVGDDQISQVEGLARLEVIDYVGCVKSEKWFEQMKASLINLCKNRDKRMALGERALNCIDGNGGLRIVAAIEEMLNCR